MASTDTIDFSIRRNKGIERQLVFEGLSEYFSCISPYLPKYVGFGSVWFSDFLLAQRYLTVGKMYSIESDPDVFRRAQCNKPYSSIEVILGTSHDVLQDLLIQSGMKRSTWIVWLDYDGIMDDGALGDLDLLVDRCPGNSVVIATFRVSVSSYGRDLNARRDSIESLLGLTPDDEMLTTNAAFSRYITQSVLDHMVTRGSLFARKGAVVPAFRLVYHDTQWMGTVGVFLPSSERVKSVKDLVGSDRWGGLRDSAIDTPPLTAKEAGMLRELMPSNRRITPRVLRRYGLELDQDQIDAFCEYYLEYPHFVQVSI